ncbi:type II toxin-antitoxin system PemK/MazF family toxin [Desulfosarcina variabilis]|uniref:type II toxin-antitoxin system PemK/MazF family toxin n=1 Tax=Desulfosarcina variabilis TaxID=2300 RepID=UPI003AFB2402
MQGTSQPQRAGYPLTMELMDTKLPKKSWVKISQIRILSTKRIGNKIAEASEEELALIIDGLNEIIGG